jgi:uncharacterized protein (TIGR02118 family)
MTIRLVIIYTQPENPEEWDKHYLGNHMPMGRALPGLDSIQAARVLAAADGGEVPHYRITTADFPTMEAMQAALASPEGESTATDFAAIAPPGSRIFITEIDG